jgi:hypothetical protein
MVEHIIEAKHWMIFEDPIASGQNYSLHGPLTEGCLEIRLDSETSGCVIHTKPFMAPSHEYDQIMESQQRKHDLVA